MENFKIEINLSKFKIMILKFLPSKFHELSYYKFETTPTNTLWQLFDSKNCASFLTIYLP